ncbi:MAG: hypothetical protein KIS66_05400 [Fimbriimonadaceae bacterium]|nr:hypothetical protein [Fimbriimonadaceae bacterium]
MLLERLAPLAINMAWSRDGRWPFCEAMDHEGRLLFYPHPSSSGFTELTREEEIVSTLRLGGAAGAFRSLGLVTPTSFATGSGVTIDLWLGGACHVTVFLRVRRFALSSLVVTSGLRAG